MAHVMRLPVPSAKDGWNPQKLEEARKGPSPEAFRETGTRRCPDPKLPSPELWENQCPRFADASLSSPVREHGMDPPSAGKGSVPSKATSNEESCAPDDVVQFVK